jgi:hypothetical protein
MHAFKAEHIRSVKAAAPSKLGHALRAVDEYLRGQTALLVDYAERYRAGKRVGTSITEAQRIPSQPTYDQRGDMGSALSKGRTVCAPQRGALAFRCVSPVLTAAFGYSNGLTLQRHWRLVISSMKP